MNHLKFLAVLLVILFSAPAVAQESFVLYTKGHWQVAYKTTASGYVYCIAEVESDKFYFSIDVGIPWKPGTSLTTTSSVPNSLPARSACKLTSALSGLHPQPQGTPAFGCRA